VFNTTDQQKKIINDIISDESHWDAEEYKSSWGDIVSWGGMKRLLNEGHLSTTNDASKKRLTDDVVNFYLKNCLSTHGLLKCGQETSQGNFFFFTTYLYQTLLQEKSENINCRGTYLKRAAPATMPTNGLKVLWAYEYAQKRKNCTGKFKGLLPGN
jgi:hypothetical protein